MILNNVVPPSHFTFYEKCMNFKYILLLDFVCKYVMVLLLKSGNLYDPIYFLLSVTILLIQLNCKTLTWLREGLLVYFDLLILCYSPLENRVIEVIETTVIRFFNWQGYIEKYMYNYCTLNRILRNSKCKIEWLPLVICKSTFLRIIKPSTEHQECFGPFSYL